MTEQSSDGQDLNAPAEDIGLDVTLAIIQGMTSMSNATNAALIASLKPDADRYRVLAAAIRDLADRIDSRRIADALYALVCRVEDMSPEAAEKATKDINHFNYSRPRVTFDADWNN